MSYLQDTKKLVKDAFRDVEGFVGVSIGDERIRVYVKDETFEHIKLKRFNMIALEFVVVGEIKAFVKEAFPDFDGNLVFLEKQPYVPRSDN